MRPVEYGPHAIKGNSQTRTRSFGYLRAVMQEQGFDVGPPHIGSHGISEDAFERPVVLAHLPNDTIL
jgi:hypothetical protein